MRRRIRDNIAPLGVRGKNIKTAHWSGLQFLPGPVGSSTGNAGHAVAEVNGQSPIDLLPLVLCISWQEPLHAQVNGVPCQSERFSMAVLL
jgi:hypothetical protein